MSSKLSRDYGKRRYAKVFLISTEGYSKEIPANLFECGRVGGAIARAKAIDTPPYKDWPRTTGTTVYRLVEAILKNEISNSKEHNSQESDL